jgi:tape measure domain-containing protein
MPEIYGFAIKVEDGAVKSIDAIDSSLGKLEGHASKASSGFMDTFKGFLGADMVMKSFSMIKEGIMDVIKVGSEMEQTHLAFEVMLGSAKKGEAMASGLKAWSDVTPFDLGTVDEAGKTLLNFGVAGKDVLPSLKLLGDASGGVKEKFERLSYAFGQAASMGKLDSRIMREMTMAGFNPLQELAKSSGKSMPQIREEMAKGQIPFSDLVKALKLATGEGGRFFGMMHKQSQTVGGLWSTLKATMQGGEFGLFQRMAPSLKGIEQDSIRVGKSLADWITPKHSEVLKDQKNEMQGLFEAIKDGNTPTNIRKDLIQELNAKYPEYIKNLISEKDTVAQIAEKQKLANKAMEDDINLAVGRETKIRYKTQLADATADLEKILVLGNEIKNKHIKPEAVFSVKEMGLRGLSADFQSGFKDLYQNLNFFKPNQGLKQNSTRATDFIIEYAKEANSKITDAKRKLLELNKTFKDVDELGGGVTPPEGMGMGEDMSGITAGAAGGLGAVKNINISIDKWNQINTGHLDSKDLQKTNEMGVEQLIKEIHNQLAGAGTM